MNKFFLTLALLTSTLAAAEMRVMINGVLTKIDYDGELLIQKIDAKLTFKSVGDAITVQEEDGTLTYTLVDTNEQAFTVSIEIDHSTKKNNEESSEENTNEFANNPIENDFIIGFTSEWNKSCSIGLGNNSSESVSLAIASYKS